MSNQTVSPTVKWCGHGTCAELTKENHIPNYTQYTMNIQRILTIQSKKWKPQGADNQSSNSSDITPISDGTRFEQESKIENEAAPIGTNLSSVTDAVVTKKEIKRVTDLPATLLSTPNDDLSLSIINFLMKPQPITSGIFASTDGPNTFGNVNWGAPLLNSIYANKLSGVLGIKATLVLTLVSNPNRFQRGRYIMAFLPSGGGQLGTTAAANWLLQHRFSKVQITQLPHVEFDIAGDTQVQLRVPWASAMNYLPIVAGSSTQVGSPGVWFLYPYYPLSSTAGSTTCGYTVFAHFDDITLVGNTCPQSGWFPQAGNTRKGKDLLTEETQKKGSISGGLSLISSTANALASVPALSAIAQPTAWLTDAMSGAAAYFGWSKPIQLDEVQRFQTNPIGMLCNVDTKDPVYPMSLLSANHVGSLPGFSGTDFDEMSIDYLKKIQYYHTTITWNLTDAAGTVLYNTDLYPGKFSQSISDGTNSLVCRGPISWLSDYFTYYTGSINIHIKMVKTEFHSGRLMFAFFPQETFNSGANPTGVSANYDYVHRELFDVRTANEITINIPFTSLLNWRPVTGTGASYGWFAVKVQDVLTAPATVSSSIQFIVEVSGGDDMQFSVPKQVGYAPVVPATFQSGWRPQGAEENVLVEETIGGADMDMKNLSICEATVGEAVPSIRYLLKRGGPMFNTATQDAFTQKTVYPFGYNMANSSPGPGVTVSDPRGQTVDFYAQLCQIYALSRGGVRLRILPYGPGTNTIADTTMFASLIPLTTVSSNTIMAISSPSIDTFTNNCDMTNIAFTYLKDGFQVQIPQYHFVHSRPSISEGINSAQTYGSGPLCSNMSVAIFCSTPNLKQMIYRSGADDCNFGLFVSIPPYI